MFMFSFFFPPNFFTLWQCTDYPRDWGVTSMQFVHNYSYNGFDTRDQKKVNYLHLVTDVNFCEARETERDRSSRVGII